MSDPNSSLSKVITTSTTFVDKAVEFRHFMLMISFLLALDSCLIFFYQKNLLHSFESFNSPEVNAGAALIFLGIFSFFMSLFFPALRQLLLSITLGFKAQLTTSISKSNPDIHCIYITRKKALIDRDKLVIELLDKQETQRSEHETNMNIAFGLILIFILNFLNPGSDGERSLTQTAAMLLDSTPGFWPHTLLLAMFGTFNFFLLVLAIMSLTPSDKDEIYLPESEMEKSARLQNDVTNPTRDEPTLK